MNDPILCPRCGGDYTHHDDVTVFIRGEDAETGTEVRVNDDSVVVFEDHKLHGNPSSRRDGLTIRFVCELCEGVSHITIQQHKGQTYINVEATTIRSYVGSPHADAYGLVKENE